MAKKRVGEPRRTLLKIRATPLVRMPKDVFFDKIRSACRRGVVPDDIVIETLNWDHAKGSRYMPGRTLSGSDRKELRNCYALLMARDTDSIRFDKPR